MEEKVIEMALCETQILFLRPNQLYRFVVIPGCAECARLAAIYDKREENHG
jgi:hypothetical protein